MHKAKVGTIKPNSVYSWRGLLPRHGRGGVAIRPQLKSQLNLMTRGVDGSRQVGRGRSWGMRKGNNLRYNANTGESCSAAELLSLDGVQWHLHDVCNTRRSRGQHWVTPFSRIFQRQKPKTTMKPKTGNKSPPRTKYCYIPIPPACPAWQSSSGCANVLLLTHLHSADIVVAPLNLMNTANCSTPPL